MARATTRRPTAVRCTAPTGGLTPTRARIAVMVKTTYRHRVYSEARQVWNRVTGEVLTSAVRDLHRAGWLREVPGESHGRMSYAPTAMGWRLLVDPAHAHIVADLGWRAPSAWTTDLFGATDDDVAELNRVAPR